ncbi:MAG: DUF202 domain-containing protein [Patescibacteria group bacterium]|nr:DUF202 domain-containing protein [Patescibacteria group bacterium]
MKKKISVFIVAGIVYLIGQYFRGVWFLGSFIPNTCGHAEAGGIPFCNSPYLDTFGWPLIIIGEFLAAIGVILLFANERGFRAWLKFSLFYVPIAAALVLWIYPIHTFLGGVATYSVGVTNAGWLYVIITVIIVLWTRFSHHSAP